MDRNEQSAAADFAQTATSKVEIVVNKLMEDSTKTDRAFLTTLRNLLADVRARLSEPCDFASFAVDNKFGRRLLRVLRALEGLVNVGPYNLSIPLLSHLGKMRRVFQQT